MSWLEECITPSCIHSLSTIATCSAGFTVVGSLYILQDILKDEERRSNVKNKIIVCMSLSDFVFNLFGPILGLTMVPADNDFGINSNGTFTTCTIQGFFYVWGGTMSSCYNATLAICFVLIVKYGYRQDQLRNCQGWLIYLPLGIGLAVSMPAIPLESYNYSELLWACDIGSIPRLCDSAETCTRGEYAAYFHYVLFFFVIVSVGTIVTALFKLYKELYFQEEQVLGLRTSENSALSNQSRILSRAAKRAGLWYSAAYLVTFFPISISFFWKPSPFWLQVMVAFSFHLIGFCNAFIYARPMCLVFRRRYPNQNWFWTFVHVVCRTEPSRVQALASGEEMNTTLTQTSIVIPRDPTTSITTEFGEDEKNAVDIEELIEEYRSTEMGGQLQLISEEDSGSHSGSNSAQIISCSHSGSNSAQIISGSHSGSSLEAQDSVAKSSTSACHEKDDDICSDKAPPSVASDSTSNINRNDHE